jgi:outer membrane beta-barrel protein
MESGIFGLFLKRALVVATLATALPAVAAEELAPLELEPLVVREVERREVDVDRIDTEDFEVGLYAGVMNFEDFGSDGSVGIRAAYHVTEDFFVEATYGESDLGQTSFEDLSGGARLLTDSEREVSYYNVSLGWNVLPGESFIWDRWAFKGSLYLLAGAGSTDFGGDDVFTVNAGLGYRFVAKDWLALHVTVRDHMFESDLLGESETKHNVEVLGGFTIFF